MEVTEIQVNTQFKKPKARKVVDGKIEVYGYEFTSEWLKGQEGKIVNIVGIINNGDTTFTAVLAEGAGIPGKRLDRPAKPKKPKSVCKKPHVERTEYAAYEKLLEWTESNKPLALLVYVLEAKKTATGWRVPSKTAPGGYYDIPEDLSACDSKCEGFRARKYCNHLKAMALRSQIEYKAGYILIEAEPVSVDEDGLP